MKDLGNNLFVNRIFIVAQRKFQGDLREIVTSPQLDAVMSHNQALTGSDFSTSGRVG